jgi:DNA-binding MarR family transcriptional regulator
MKAIDHDFLFLIYDLAQSLRTLADQRARLNNMTRAQWAILVRLERQPGISQTELAALSDVEPITVCRLVDRLEEQGFVERKPDPNDRRINRLHLTPKAKPVLRDIAAFRQEFHRCISEGIDPETLDLITKGLLHMKANLSDPALCSKTQNKAS